jgi:hypothetical protein
MREQVTVVAMTACDGVSELINKREQDIAEARKQLDDLQHLLDRTADRLSPNKTTNTPK